MITETFRNDSKLLKEQIPSPSIARKILLVEDDPHWQLFISRSIRRFDPNATLRCVRSVNHAERILFSDPSYDLVIADYLLDGHATGMDLWHTCKGEYPNTNFLMISGLESKEFEGARLKGGSFPVFLPKPFASAQMAEFLRPVSRPIESRKFHLKKGIRNILFGLALAMTMAMTGMLTYISTSISHRAEIPLKSATNPKIAQGKISAIFTPQLLTQMEELLQGADRLVAAADVKPTKRW